ncbi:hypothetical protein MN032_16465 [Agromyces atrinae]|uniref:hypothetical protein n=1 Tax=Agromyces atrinae TaxID=592376 RepID=UPI001F59D6B0|nr:hypothetical protein [Agromyces atrinae]MCI2959282.1 hypothetical protein [Agromyces atrinae]
MREIRLFPEVVTDWPLWDDEGDDTSAEALGLSPQLAERLIRWNDMWQTGRDPIRGWRRESDRLAWEAERPRLVRALAAELRGVATVIDG